VCEIWSKNSQPFGKKCQKTSGGIFFNSYCSSACGGLAPTSITTGTPPLDPVRGNCPGLAYQPRLWFIITKVQPPTLTLILTIIVFLSLTLGPLWWRPPPPTSAPWRRHWDYVCLRVECVWAVRRWFHDLGELHSMAAGSELLPGNAAFVHWENQTLFSRDSGHH